MYARPSAPLSIGGVIDDAIKLYLASFSRCWVIALMSAAITAILSLTLLAHVPQTLGNARQALEQILAVEKSPGFIVGYLVTVLMTLIFHGALLARQNALARGDASFTLAHALGAGLRKLPAMLLVVILFLVAAAIGLSAIVFPRLGVGGRILGLAAYVVAAAYLIGRLVLWMPALFVDDTGPLQSIDMSWKLTQGRWWRAAAIVTVAVIIILVFSLVFGLIAGILGGIFAAFGQGSASHRLTALQLISSAANVITLPMAPALWLAMYNDFKLRREGGDLAARVGALPGT